MKAYFKTAKVCKVRFWLNGDLRAADPNLLASLAKANSKEDEFADIYKEEIDELKENLERKEYLLQLVE